MKCQILFSGKTKKSIVNLSSAENAQRMVKVKAPSKICSIQAWHNVTYHGQPTCEQFLAHLVL